MANDSPNTVKVSGYLEKKSRMKVVSSWKKYWFVLEGRSPLLYYRSKDEYDAISPCKGTISLGPPCNIKPIAGTYCFQLETRRNTVTLRAENKYEHGKWIQAILSALNQSSCSSPTNRMSHFRYSSDDLSPTSQLIKEQLKFHPELTRQTTSPIESRGSKDQQEIIQTLKSLGAQRYGGSLIKFPQLVHRHSCSNQSLNSKPNSRNSTNMDSCLENDLYDISSRGLPTKSSSISNLNAIRLDDGMVDNDHYCVNIGQRSNRNSSATTGSSGHIDNTFLVDNEQYSTTTNDNEFVVLRRTGYEQPENLYERISDESVLSRDFSVQGRQSENVESDLYSTVNERSSSDSSHCGQPTDTLVENEYALPMANDIPKKFRKSAILDNDQYISSAPAECEYEECNNYPEESIYEEPDQCKESALYQEIEPEVPPRQKESISSSSSSISDQKTASKKSSNENLSPGKPKKRQNSFLNKIMKWKRKSRDKSEENSPQLSPTQSVNSKLEIVQDLEVLTELQQILNARKNDIEKKLHSTVENGAEERKGLIEELRKVQIQNEGEKWKPALPDKQNSPSKKLKQNVEDPQPKLKTIDEILEDLDKEKAAQNSKMKVRDLIEKFETDDVQLRKKSPFLRRKNTDEPKPSTHRHSEELTRLLEELAKVTNAPIMEPGVTSSLVTSDLHDDDWFNLMPIRYRRMSDPDYDIPRPHRSLQLLLAKKSSKVTQGLRSTCNAKVETRITTLDRLIPSMTPDSLEVNNTKTESMSFSHKSPQPKQRLSSHITPPASPIINKISRNSINSEYANEVIYARPRQIIPNFKFINKNNNYENVTIINNHRNGIESYDYRRSNGSERTGNGNVQNYFKVGKIYEDSGIKSLDIFVDSLEPSGEISTIF